MLGTPDIVDAVMTPTSDHTTTGYEEAVANSENNLDKNMKGATNPGSVYWLFLIIVIYVVWGYWQDKGIGETSKFANIKLNLHNMVTTTLSVVIGFNVLNVFLTKIGAMNIPLLSRGAGAILPLFHL